MFSSIFFPNKSKSFQPHLQYSIEAQKCSNDLLNYCVLFTQLCDLYFLQMVSDIIISRRQITRLQYASVISSVRAQYL